MHICQREHPLFVLIVSTLAHLRKGLLNVTLTLHLYTIELMNIFVFLQWDFSTYQ